MHDFTKAFLAASLLSGAAFAHDQETDLETNLHADISSVILQHEHVFNPDFLKVSISDCAANKDESEATCSGVYRIYYQDPFFYENAPMAFGEFLIVFGLKNGRAAFVIDETISSEL